MNEVMIWIFIGGYFIPAIIAVGNNKKNKAGITILNLFLGWTFVGWVIALVWAVMEDE